MIRQIKTYSELSKLETYEERFKYLMLDGKVGEETFGFDRYLNQQLYKSKEWMTVRDEIIVRDNGSDLGVDGNEIFGTIHIHHMNPITSKDIVNSTEYLLNPEYLIAVSPDTHRAIHYGVKDYVESKKLIIRKPNDHCPWKK